MKKLLFVYNPHAGKARLGNYLERIVQIFDGEEYEVTLRPTHAHGDASGIFRENADRYDRVVVSGGDGTLNEAVTGLIQAKAEGKTIPPLGYLPAGSTNDFASSLGIPAKPLAAAKTAAAGVPFCCDAGRLNETPFVYVAAFGAFTEVSYATPQQTKNALGHLAYLLEGVKSLPQIHGIPMKVTTGDEVTEGRFLFGMISNTTSVGGFRALHKKQKVALNDGLFEVLLVREANTFAEQSDLISALLRMDLKSKHFVTAKVPRISFESSSPVAWTVDGEFGGQTTNAVAEVLTGAYTILVP